MFEYKWRYMAILVAPVRNPVIVNAAYEPFTEDDICEMEKLGVERESVERLNELMGFSKRQLTVIDEGAIRNGNLQGV